MHRFLSPFLCRKSSAENLWPRRSSRETPPESRFFGVKNTNTTTPRKTVKRGSSSEDDCPPNGAVLLRGVDTQQHTRVVVDGLWEVEEGTT